MCRFYGWTLAEVLALDIDTFEQMWLAVTTLEAREMLNQMTANDWPKMKESARKKLHSELSKEAYPASLKPTKVISNAELARVLGGG